MGTMSLRKDTGASETEPANSRAASDVIIPSRQALRQRPPWASSDINFIGTLM